MCDSILSLPVSFVIFLIISTIAIIFMIIKKMLKAAIFFVVFLILVFVVLKLAEGYFKFDLQSLLL